jgi:hypothetical protein
MLPQVMAELGVRRFASGGFAGRGSSSSGIGGAQIGNITVINHANQPVDEKRLAAEIIKKVEQAQYNSWKGR